MLLPGRATKLPRRAPAIKRRGSVSRPVGRACPALLHLARGARFRPMEEAEVIFYFDYVDPACYLLDQALRALLPDGVTVARRPFELRRPPLPPIDPESKAWRSRCHAVQRGAADYGLAVSIPGRMPWSRKAHELSLHARAKGCCEAMHSALFRAFFERKADIGRIDVLIALAEKAGLDPTEARAVLDVDRYAAEVEEMREAALRSGVRGPPTVEAGGRRLEGLPGRQELLRFLRTAAC